VFVVYFAGSGLRVEVITRSEQSYSAHLRARVWTCVYLMVCDLETSTSMWPGTDLGCNVTEKKWYRQNM